MTEDIKYFLIRFYLANGTFKRLREFLKSFIQMMGKIIVFARFSFLVQYLDYTYWTGVFVRCQSTC